MEPSKGVKTTEFWMFCITGVALLINGSALVDVPPDQMMAWMAMTGLYGGLRTAEKTLTRRAPLRGIQPATPS